MLDTPMKRFGALIVVIGLAMLVVAVWQWGPFADLDSCLLDGSRRVECRSLRRGLALVGLGVLLPPLVGWIRHGRPPRNR